MSRDSDGHETRVAVCDSAYIEETIEKFSWLVRQVEVGFTQLSEYHIFGYCHCHVNVSLVAWRTSYYHVNVSLVTWRTSIAMLTSS